MLVPVIIDFDTASLLAVSRDIGVMESSTGQWFTFTDYEWPDHGILMDRDQLIEKLGTVGLNMEYVYVWMNIVE